jgi:aerotaxis receptor
MPKSAFADVWQTLKSGNSWSGYIKNMRKDRGYYWVEADISGVYKDGKLVEYKSVRSPMGRDIKIKMQKEYDKKRVEQDGIMRVTTYKEV